MFSREIIVMGSQALACRLQWLLKINKNSGEPGEVRLIVVRRVDDVIDTNSAVHFEPERLVIEVNEIESQPPLSRKLQAIPDSEDDCH